MMQTAANRATCEGTGFCEQVAPELFRVDDEGLVEQLVTEVPDDLVDAAHEAEDMCPTRSIDLSD